MIMADSKLGAVQGGIGGVVGAALGGLVGGPGGAAIGGALGSSAGSALAPDPSADASLKFAQNGNVGTPDCSEAMSHSEIKSWRADQGMKRES
jgi:phage tail tape-measure protein